MGKKNIALLLIIFLCSSFLWGCQPKIDNSAKPVGNTEKVSIALQYGLAYAPVQIMKEKNLLEKYLPGVEIEWKQLGTGPVIREAMVSGQVDIGFMGISPFLIGWDKGVPWKIAVACGSQPLGLVTYKDNIKNIKDFSPQDKIATPAIASIQHILLSMAAERELGDARYFDNHMISLTHPDALTALLGQRDVTAHFTSPPYLFTELKEDYISEVIDGETAFGGEFTFIFGVATQKFREDNPTAYAAFLAAFSEAVVFLNNNPEESAKILASSYNLTETETLEYLTWPGTNYTTTPYGIMGFAEFMSKYEFISKSPENIGEIVFENMEAAIGKRYGNESAVERLQYGAKGN